MKKEDFACIHPMRVRWAEVDMQGVVFNAHYLMYFDTAIAEYWRAISVGREKEIADLYMRLYVVKATVEYHGSAHYDEMIEVGCRVARFGRSSMTFQFAIWRGAEHLISGEIVYVHAAPEEKKSAPIPDMLRDAVLGYERTVPDAAAAGVPR
ncbi:MAG: acyl-CoA thioesterase [Burkholderiales bacterium]|jgi:acyl-CoA thioester hydrolase|nr:acyl-CoA thioesterase [Burkholderiales bacterium]